MAAWGCVVVNQTVPSLSPLDSSEHQCITLWFILSRVSIKELTLLALQSLQLSITVSTY